MRGDADSTDRMADPPPSDEGLGTAISVHDRPIETLLTHGGHAVRPTDLVIIPGAHHRRTVRQCFAQTDTADDTVVLMAPGTISDELQAAAEDTRTPRLDRADRLGLLERVLEADERLCARLALPLGVTPTADTEAVERARAAVDAVTGYHPERIGALRAWCERRADAAAEDGRDLIDAIVALERELRQHTTHVISAEMHLRRAVQGLHRQHRLLRDARPSVERLWLCGLTAPSASLCDLLGVVATATDVQVHVGVRPVSGDIVRSRIETVCETPDPGAEVV